MKFLLMLFSLVACMGIEASILPVEKNVDVSRYVGKWYAHYSLPQFFTRSCEGQTAEYEIIRENTISVFNTCLKIKGETTITGKAVVQNPGDNSKLIVTFNNFFTRLFRVKGDYNIIKLDKNYEYVLVGSNDRKSLWLMSRASQAMPIEVKQQYFKIATELGFDVTRLQESRF
jgi:apolipoprotein D and lipocalin family protein